VKPIPRRAGDGYFAGVELSHGTVLIQIESGDVGGNPAVLRTYIFATRAKAKRAVEDLMLEFVDLESE
jgi:hypothetical protein